MARHDNPLGCGGCLSLLALLLVLALVGRLVGAGTEGNFWQGVAQLALAIGLLFVVVVVLVRVGAAIWTRVRK